MKKIAILLIVSILILFGCSSQNNTDTVSENDGVNNDSNEKQTISGIVVTHTTTFVEEVEGNTTYFVEASLNNTTDEDISLYISGFGMNNDNNIYGVDESLTEFGPGEYLVPANDSISFELYYTIPNDLEVEQVLLYDENQTEYIFE